MKSIQNVMAAISQTVFVNSVLIGLRAITLLRAGSDAANRRADCRALSGVAGNRAQGRAARSAYQAADSRPFRALHERTAGTLLRYLPAFIHILLQAIGIRVINRIDGRTWSADILHTAGIRAGGE